MSVEQTEPVTGRHKLEAAVTKIGRAYDELVRTVERFGNDIKREDLDKVFVFLAEVQAGSLNKAVLSLSTAVAANGGFSLDAYEPQSTMTAHIPQFSVNTSGEKGSRFAELQEFGGRLLNGKRQSAPSAPVFDDDGLMED